MVNETSGPAMANSTFDTSLPPLPAFTIEPMPDLLPFISDFWLALILPVVVYWVLSMFFHVIDVYDIWPQYRLHTPEEILRRNHVSRYEVARDVIIQQIIQTITGALLSMGDPPQMIGKADYDVAVWARRVRLAQRALPSLLGIVGINASSMSQNMAASHPLLAGVLAGGYYPFLTTKLAGPDGQLVPAFATWELVVARTIYHLLIPALQFGIAVVWLDTWQYFLHRLMHINKWMYSAFPGMPSPSQFCC
jgi:sphinganine C4-monooxygenase